MRYRLYGFQEDAVKDLVEKIKKMQKYWHEDGDKSSIALTAPTGAGKTVICGAAIEALFFGNENVDSSDPNAVILWLSDNPSLNEQTKKRFTNMMDMLSDITDMVVIDSDFAKIHKKLERHKVYFLNRQKLVGNLGKSAEGSRTFWDVLRNTIEDPSLNLYLLIDEAHKGLGKSGDNKTTSDEQNKTIYAKLIDGQEGINPPIPVVIGISATIARWNTAMSNRRERNTVSPVEISNEKVRKAGIIKKLIELRSPKTLSDVKDQDLYMACRKLEEFSAQWEAYCVKNDVPVVIPLMVVQVEDNIKDEALWDICRGIKNALPKLDEKTAFANVFGEHKGRGNDMFNIPYVSPDDVQEMTDIHILFAKDAISTGWDCPRAEVLYSRRKRQDKTYIHQMFGRMIRTPLAHKIDDNDFLNKVVCYLPEYDTKSVEEIVELIKNDKDIGETSEIRSGDTEAGWYSDIKDTASDVLDAMNVPSPVIAEPTELFPTPPKAKVENPPLFNSSTEDKVKEVVHKTVENNGIVPDGVTVPTKSKNKNVNVDTDKLKKTVSNLPTTDRNEDIKLKESFEGIVSRTVGKKDVNKIKQFFRVMDFLVAIKYPGTDDSWENDDEWKRTFCNTVEYAIVLNQKKFDEALHDILYRKQRVTKVDILTGRKYTESVDEQIRNVQLSLFNFASNELYKKCCDKFNSDYVQAYFDFSAAKGLKEDEANNRLGAVISCSEIMTFLEKWASDKVNELVNKHNVNKGRLSESNRSEWEHIVSDTQNWMERNLIVPTGSTGQNSKHKGYKKHLIASSNGLAYIKLDTLEDMVVSKEINDKYNIAWYRNPSNPSNSSLAIPQEIDKDKYKNFYPDFIFFERTNDGKIIRNIVDPHGDWIGDSISRLLGYIKYLEDHGDDFAKVLAITETDKGVYRYLDLKNPQTVKAILDFTGTMARPLFEGKHSQLYCGGK